MDRGSTVNRGPHLSRNYSRRIERCVGLRFSFSNWIDRIIIFLINCELFPSDIALEKSKINENFD